MNFNKVNGMLKSIALLIAMIGLFGMSASAQIKPAEESNASMSLGTNRCWKIFIPEASVKEVENDFKKLLKNYNGKVSKVKKSDDIQATELEIPYLSDGTVSLVYQVKSATQGSYLLTFVQIQDRYLSTEFHGDKCDQWNKELQNFARNLTLDIIKDRADEAEKDLKKLNKDFDGLKKDKSNYEKDIQDCENTIKQRKQDIIQNTKDQESKQKEIADQKAKLNEIQQKMKKY